MPMKFKCPECAIKVKVSSKHAGKQLKCPQCRETIRVPLVSMPTQGDSKSSTLKSSPQSVSAPLDDEIEDLLSPDQFDDSDDIDFLTDDNENSEDQIGEDDWLESPSDDDHDDFLSDDMFDGQEESTKGEPLRTPTAKKPKRKKKISKKMKGNASRNRPAESSNPLGSKIAYGVCVALGIAAYVGVKLFLNGQFDNLLKAGPTPEEQWVTTERKDILKFETPGPVKLQTKAEQGVRMDIWMCEKSRSLAYLVAYSQTALPLHRRNLDVNIILNDSCNGSLQRIERENPVEKYRKRLDYNDNIPGMEMEVYLQKQSAKMISRVYLHNNHVYMLMVIGRNISANDPDVVRFQSRFVIHEIKNQPVVKAKKGMFEDDVKLPLGSKIKKPDFEKSGLGNSATNKLPPANTTTGKSTTGSTGTTKTPVLKIPSNKPSFEMGNKKPPFESEPGKLWNQDLPDGFAKYTKHTTPANTFGNLKGFRLANNQQFETIAVSDRGYSIWNRVSNNRDYTYSNKPRIQFNPDHFSFSPDGSRLAFIRANDYVTTTLNRFATTNNEYKINTTSKADVTALAISPRDEFCIGFSNRNLERFSSRQPGSKGQNVIGIRSVPTAAAYSLNGDYLAVVDGSFHIYDVDHDYDHLVYRDSSSNEKFNDVYFSKDTKHLIGVRGKTLICIDYETKPKLKLSNRRTISFDEAVIKAMFTKNNSNLIVLTEEGLFHILEAKTLKSVKTIKPKLPEKIISFDLGFDNKMAFLTKSTIVQYTLNPIAIEIEN